MQENRQMTHRSSADVNNRDDLIDSRNVDARIDELEDERVSWLETEKTDWSEENESDAEELAALLAFREDARRVNSEWNYGATFIRDSYFAEYAEELADDIGAIDSDARWPLNHIDWDAAADELKQDYSSVDFDGVEYWVRST
jgi:hypothetical protein